MDLRSAPKPAFREWNEGMARKYSPGKFHEESHPLIRWIERRRVAALVRMLQPVAGHRVLEVGCGAGNVLQALPASAALVGVHLSTSLVAEARERLASRAGRVPQADSESLPFRASSFSRIVCTEVLEHVQRPDVVLAEIVRVAAPGRRH